MKNWIEESAIKLIYILLLIALVGGGGFYIYQNNLKQTANAATTEETEKENAVSVVAEHFENMAELNTASYLCTVVEEKSSSKTIYGWEVPLTEKSFTISYDGIVKAGIKDLSQVQVTSKDENTILVTLPVVEITSKEIDKDTFKVYDESHNIFNMNSPEDVNEAQKDMEQEMETKAEKYGLLDQAKTNAETILSSMLKNMVDGYDVVFEWK